MPVASDSATMPNQMRAAKYHRFGGPEVLQIDNVDVPLIQDDYVLVRVRGAGLSGGEPAIHAGKVAMVMGKTFPQGVGVDFAGEIVALGRDVQIHKVGESVWGVMPHKTFGAIAEYVAVPENRIAKIPSNLSVLQAASLPAVGTTIVRALAHEVDLKRGERILIRGASGGVGIAAIQYAKFLGAEVTALAGTKNQDWLAQMGADKVFDYNAVDLSRLGAFDVILDVVGTHIESFRRLLSRNGRMVELGFDPDHLLRTMLYVGASAVFGTRRVPLFSNDPSNDDLEKLARLVEQGAMAPVIERTWSLNEVGDVYRIVGHGGVRGRHLITFD